MASLFHTKGVIMAKIKTKATFDVTGLSIEDILKMDYDKILKMNEKDLKRVTSRLVSSANKRLVRLEKSEIGKNSPQYQNYKERGTKFSVKGKNRAQTLKEFKALKTFHESKTGSVRGFKKVRKQQAERLGEIKLTEYQNNRFWKVYHELENNNSGVLQALKEKYSSTQIQQMLHDTLLSNKKMGVKRLTDKFLSNLDMLYEDVQRTTTGDFSGLFEDAEDLFEIEEE